MKSVNTKWARSSESLRQQTGKSVDLFAADTAENLEIPSVDSARTLKSAISSIAPLRCPNWSPKFSHNLSGDYGPDEEYTVRSSVSSVKLLSCPPWQPKFAVSLVGRELSPTCVGRTENSLLGGVAHIRPLSDVLADSDTENRNDVNFSFRSDKLGLTGNSDGKKLGFVREDSNHAGQLLRRRESLRSRLNNISDTTKWRGSASSSVGSDAPSKLPFRTADYPLFSMEPIPDPNSENGLPERQRSTLTDKDSISSSVNALVFRGALWSDHTSGGDSGCKSFVNGPYGASKIQSSLTRRDNQFVLSEREKPRGELVKPRLTTRETAASITECDDDYCLSDAQSLNQCITRDADIRKMSAQQFQRDQAAGQDSLRNAANSTNIFPVGKSLRLDFLSADNDLYLSMDKPDTRDIAHKLQKDRGTKAAVAMDFVPKAQHDMSAEVGSTSDFRSRVTQMRQADRSKALPPELHLGMSKSVRGKSDVRYAASDTDLYRSVFFAELSSAFRRRGATSGQIRKDTATGSYPIEITDVPPIRVETRWGALSLDYLGNLTLIVKRAKSTLSDSMTASNDGDSVENKFVVSAAGHFHYEAKRYREGSQHEETTGSMADSDVGVSVEVSAYDSVRNLPPYLKRKLDYITSMATYFRSASPRIIISDTTGIFSLFWKSDSETRRANLSKSLCKSTSGGYPSESVDTEFRAELNSTIFTSVKSVAFCSGQVSICSRDDPPRVVDVQEHIFFSMRENSKASLNDENMDPLRGKLIEANLSVESVLQAWNVAFSRYVRCLKLDIKAHELVNRRLRSLLVENSAVKCVPRDLVAGVALPEPPKDFKQIWRQAYLHVMPVMVLN